LDVYVNSPVIFNFDQLTMDELHHDNERHLVENYMKLYCLEELLDETVNTILEHRPDNPYVELARLIENKSMAEILDVQISGSLGEQGRSSVTATIVTNMGSFNGSFGMATKQYLEEEELIKDFSMSTGKVNAILKGLDPRNMREIDEKLSASQSLNPSVVVALSIACCRAAARHRGTSLYQFLAEQADNTELLIPVPVCTPVARSAAGRTNIDGLPLVQDITLTPTNVSTFEAAMEALNAATNLINRALMEKTVPTSVYKERGAVNLVYNTLEETLGIISPVLEAMTGSSQIKIGLDARINNFLYTMPVKEDAKPGSGDVYYLLKAVELPPVLSPRSAAAAAPKGQKVDPAALAAAAAAAPPPVPDGAVTGAEMVNLYVDLWKAHGILTLEEPFHSADMAGIKAFKQVGSINNSAAE